ncbi:hypothetical protein NCCP1664_24790 [Zafaria cholistanensis]|uniref:Uncharacterized protein n=1 Tax=Zafaria cholistanensis TaxID=1682741 RepID=A0A5A7NSU1_9MICC|nr:hypothetical protein [Zafaria cholistanensis]GER23984.1 hypothetical protein NCCP1664_24790 [Zafaria cholistanensis]
MNTRRIPTASIAARWNPSDQAVDLVIDGRAVIDIVDPQKQWGVSPFARRFVHSSARGWLAEYRGVCGDRDERLLEGELEIAVCRACGDLDCGNLAVYVDRDADTVVWRQPHWAGDDEDDDEDDEEPESNDPTVLMPQVVVFDRAEYEAALADVERFINRPGWRREIPEAASWLDRLRNRFTSVWEK